MATGISQQGKVRAALRTAQIRGEMVAGWLVMILRVAMYSLMVLSLLGTMYALLQEAAPLTQPWAMIERAFSAGDVFFWALGIQAVLSIGQWGSSEMISEDRRWWFLYLLVLAISVWLNLAAYYASLVNAGAPGLIAITLIILADMAPEWLLKK